jgi:hypothetical protein
MPPTCQTGLREGGHDPPPHKRSGFPASGSSGRSPTLHPAKADNFSSTNSTYKGMNHG